MNNTSTWVAGNSAVELKSALRKWAQSRNPEDDTDKSFREKINMGRLLFTIASDACLKYKISVQHRDRPDFFVQSQKQLIGVETTELGPEQLRRAEKIVRQMKHPPFAWSTTHFRFSSSHRKNSDIQRLMIGCSDDLSDWVPEIDLWQEWVSALNQLVIDKSVKIFQTEELGCCECWLLVTNSQIIGEQSENHGVRAVASQLKGYWLKQKCFSRIFVAAHRRLYMLFSEGVMSRAIVDW